MCFKEFFRKNKNAFSCVTKILYKYLQSFIKKNLEMMVEILGIFSRIKKHEMDFRTLNQASDSLVNSERVLGI